MLIVKLVWPYKILRNFRQNFLVCEILKLKKKSIPLNVTYDMNFKYILFTVKKYYLMFLL